METSNFFAYFGQLNIPKVVDVMMEKALNRQKNYSGYYWR